jgi:hypothetical protein
MRLNELIKWAAVAVLSMGAAAPSLGGSVTRPGDTIGLTVEVPLPEGLHLGNTTTEQCADASPKETCFLVDVAIVIWTTSWTIFGARLELSTAPVVPVLLHIGNTASFCSVFNPYLVAQLAWDLGNNWAAEISASSSHLGWSQPYASHNEEEL